MGNEFIFSDKINLIVGRNGIGKTNILDGIYYLASVRSNSNATDAMLVRQSQDFFRLEGVFLTKELERAKIVVKCKPGVLKELEWNGSVYAKFSDHIGKIPIVFIGPDDIDLIKGSSENRRRFLDFTLSNLSKEYLHSLISYNKYLKQKLSLLKQDRPSLPLLSMYDEKMDPLASYIHTKRKELVDQLAVKFSEIYYQISQFDIRVAVDWISDMENRSFLEVSRESRSLDIATGRCLKGPHRDDLRFSINGREARKTASQGQIKSFLLALKFSQYYIMRDAMGVNPILLLDDIFDRLDPERVRNLIYLVQSQEFGQVIISDTQAGRVKELSEFASAHYTIIDLEH